MAKAEKPSEKKDKNQKKPKVSIRERNRKAAESKEKPKRIRKAAVQAKKPVSGAAKVLTKEFHILPRKNEAGFFTRSRNVTPKYFSDSAQELKLVTWPGRRETWKLVFAVFAFALTLGIFIALLDFGISKVFRDIIL